MRTVIQFISCLTNPSAIIGILVSTIMAITGLVYKSCSQSRDLHDLQEKLITAQEKLQQCITNQAVIQADIARQATEINKYNTLASRYKRELESRFSTLPPAPTCEQGALDFSNLNSLLLR